MTHFQQTKTWHVGVILHPYQVAVSAAAGSTQTSSSPAWRSWGSPGPASSAVRSLHSPTAPSLYRQEGQGKGQRGQWFSISAERAKVWLKSLNKPEGICHRECLCLASPVSFFHFLSLCFSVCQPKSFTSSHSPPASPLLHVTSQTKQGQRSQETR